MRQGTSVGWVGVLAAAIATLGGAGVAQAASFEVNTAADAGTGGCDAIECTLREAVAAAEAGPDADTITFAPALAGQTIALASAGDTSFGASALAVTTEITIRPGGDHSITIGRAGGAPGFRLFHVTAGGDLTLESLTLRDGVARGGDGGTGAGSGGGGGAGLGGAILNRGTLEVRDSILTANQAIGGKGGDAVQANGGGVGGVPNGGAGAGRFGPAGQAGGFGGGGGGSHFSGTNPEGQGGFGGGAGGVACCGPAGGGGGGGLGGAIFNDGGSVTVANSTLSGNSAVGGAGGASDSPQCCGPTPGNPGGGFGAGLFNRSGAVAIANATFSDNSVSAGSGGIYNLGDGALATGAATLSLDSSIAANTSGGNDFQSSSIGGGVASTSGSHNLIESQSGFGGSSATGDPALGPLADNGGLTETQLPLDGSPAIDQGKAVSPPLSFDQRGEQRPQDDPRVANPAAGDGSDIGAVEVHVPPVLSISDASVTEGTGTDSTLEFTISLQRADSAPISVDYATVNGSATTPGDYVMKSGTVSFAPGETSKPVSVTVNGDALDESDETFEVNLSNPANAAIGDRTGVGTIVDDDPETMASIGDLTVTEGDSGKTDAVFAVTLAAASGKAVSIAYATAAATATAPSDYDAQSGALKFAPGETSKQVTVTVNGDALDESDETFEVNLSNPANAAIADGKGLGTIRDDDEPTPPPSDPPADDPPAGDEPDGLSLPDGKVPVRKGFVNLELTCASGGDCADGKLTLRSLKKVALDKPSKAMKKRKLKLGKAFFDIPAGETETVAVKLTKPGRKALKQARGGKLRALATATYTGGEGTKQTATSKIKLQR